MKNIFAKAAIFVFIVATLFFGASLVFFNVYGLGDAIVISNSDIASLEPRYPITLSKEETDNGVNLQYRVYNLPIKSVYATVADRRTVVLGGIPLGISVMERGLTVTGKNNVLTRNGMVCPAKDIDIKVGDIVLSINGIEVNTQNDVLDVLSKASDEISLTVLRESTQFEVKMVAATDLVSKQRRLGLVLTNEIAGIGTMTYINLQNGRYGALGHPIKDSQTGRNMSTPNGNIYNSNIFGVIKGQKGKAGELSGSFSKGTSPLGTIDANNEFGIFGRYEADTSGMKTVELGSMYTVKAGKASIYTTINGNKPEQYEIEIVKTAYQNQAKSKGMVIKVTDKRLLDATGGIVQGMSGSPIIQNGKLVGAVTHVFINDPTRGYGVYIDWMINN